MYEMRYVGDVWERRIRASNKGGGKIRAFTNTGLDIPIRELSSM